ncbi:MAG: glycosyltransferase family 4 protein [Croceibacterium sp.]
MSVDQLASVEPTYRDSGAAVLPLFPGPLTQRRPVRRVALIGTFVPRKCGIATFTNDVFEKLAKYYPEVRVDVYVLDDPESGLVYHNIAGTIAAGDPEAYARAAERINASGVDAVWLQHEYGIFGGPDGELVCDFVDRLAAPLILTPHTVLTDPSERQRAILHHLIARASRIMVMSRHSCRLLKERYSAPAEILEVVPHGAPDRPFGRGEAFKDQLGLADKNVLMTFGLLGPGKGLERVIEALPAIVARHPDTIYRIVGATHPNLVANEGEAYRERLQAAAEALGVADHIQWDNRFLETDELLDQLEACDIYLTPYFNLQQSTSGTLSYAVALGKAVVATPYVHAQELLAGNAGVLIEPDSAPAIAAAVICLLDDPGELLAVQRRAYARGRQTIWPRFADGAAGLIEAAVAPPASLAPLAANPSLAAVFAMSDGTGMLQHSIDIVPDRRHGYCLDDNARALMLMNVARGISEAERMRWSLTYASFVQYAWNDDEGGFRNFMRFDRSWCEDHGSEDSNGRAVWALGHTIEHSPDQALRDWGMRWFLTALPLSALTHSPRARAFAMLGAAAVLRTDPRHKASREFLAEGAEFLHHLLDAERRPDWAWFESVLGYDNPRLPQALLEAGMALERTDYAAAGLETLEWIATQQIAASGNFRPIGSDTFGRRHAHLPFDQQPLEAQAAIDAAASAYSATGDDKWFVHAQAAYGWFFGANDRGVVLADLATGRCRDGVTPRGVNRNSGAESILAFQLAHYSVLALAGAQRRDSLGAESGRGGCVVEQSVAHP